MRPGRRGIRLANRSPLFSPVEMSSLFSFFFFHRAQFRKIDERRNAFSFLSYLFFRMKENSFLPIFPRQAPGLGFSEMMRRCSHFTPSFQVDARTHFPFLFLPPFPPPRDIHGSFKEHSSRAPFLPPLSLFFVFTRAQSSLLPPPFSR